MFFCNVVAFLDLSYSRQEKGGKGRARRIRIMWSVLDEVTIGVGVVL
jgi:hypothetical protein